MQFNKLTEVAMQLMDAGEADVYTQNKVVALRCACFGPAAGLAGGQSRAAACAISNLSSTNTRPAFPLSDP